MYRPIEKDQRYTVSLEFTGKLAPQHVARFCGEWIGSTRSLSGAVMLAVGHNARRRGAMIIEAIE